MDVRGGRSRGGDVVTRANLPTPFQKDLLVALLNEQAVDEDHTAEGCFLLDYIAWPENAPELQMRNFDRALDALVRKGFAVQITGESAWYLTPAGKSWAEQERDRRRARNVR
jgi:hypothetical protein